MMFWFFAPGPEAPLISDMRSPPDGKAFRPGRSDDKGGVNTTNKRKKTKRQGRRRGTTLQRTTRQKAR